MMYKKILLLPFSFYLVPYMHLSLAIDYLFDSLIGIFLFMIVTITIGFYAKKIHCISLLILGNIINILLSYTLIVLKSPLVELYHSSSPFIVAIPLIILFLFTQLTGIFWTHVLQKEGALSTDKGNKN
ncbi:hypothetical protein [Enterococcus dongliensis]|uniref:hypothetical protein n=1 Tax=Enterococcus dongliensis TaxID=2559925 RepID=UPI00289202FA|nr:hypothetical protein [Enterococcus dongliensis]MDT2602995.1 hypothetical protein [Enterococcus dongliensis]MDT2644575.1 hypothetical protein [Enterococcus dongliensis]MDT2670691.1 hypothetical protein [Enterococcus dongliensis]MDT2710656.1 hypothetical protein [Enterococcus dongliensis]